MPSGTILYNVPGYITSLRYGEGFGFANTDKLPGSTLSSVHFNLDSMRQVLYRDGVQRIDTHIPDHGINPDRIRLSKRILMNTQRQSSGRWSAVAWGLLLEPIWVYDPGSLAKLIEFVGGRVTHDDGFQHTTGTLAEVELTPPCLGLKFTDVIRTYQSNVQPREEHDELWVKYDLTSSEYNPTTKGNLVISYGGTLSWNLSFTRPAH